MAKIPEGGLYVFHTGDIVDADVAPQGGALNPIFETIRVALNDTDTRVDGVYTKTEIDAILVGITAGVMNDNSVTNAKLATDVKVGSLAALNTTNKASVVTAMNEVFGLASAAVPLTGGSMTGNLSIVKTIATLILKSTGTDAGSGLTGFELRDSNNLLHWALRSTVYPGLGPSNLNFVNSAGTTVFAIGQNGVKTVDATADLNNITIANMYWAGFTTPNVPTADNYWVRHINQTTDGNYALQIAYRGASGSTNRVYTRQKDAGVWSGWTEMLTTAGGTMLGALGLVGAAGTNQFKTGTGDGASYTNYNFLLKGHWGMGMSTYDDSVNGFYDFRSGKWDVKGGYYVNGIDVREKYIAPSDNVFASINPEFSVPFASGEVTARQFTNVPKGRYRVKGEYRISNGSGGAYVRVKNTRGDGYSELQVGTDFLTASTTYVPFSIDMDRSNDVLEVATIRVTLEASNSGLTAYIRNVSICGTQNVMPSPQSIGAS